MAMKENDKIKLDTAALGTDPGWVPRHGNSLGWLRRSLGTTSFYRWKKTDVVLGPRPNTKRQHMAMVSSLRPERREPHADLNSYVRRAVDIAPRNCSLWRCARIPVYCSIRRKEK